MLLLIVCKRIRETQGSLPSQSSLAALESCLNRLAEDVTVKIGVPSQIPKNLRLS